jgi:hypothetical protein
MRTARLVNTVVALVSLFLFSCGARKAAERLTVIAPENFSGEIRIITCDPKAPSDSIAIDALGHGRTSLCSSSPDLTLRVVRGKSIDEIPAVTAKTGDDFVVSITAVVKPQNPQQKQ